ncbi:polyhydroxyalkanoate depolymerase [Noviherbaspirillum sp. UKPF54]|uniref:polyhydroxyalkanoate depolymerase n=1 Tax=Noviherbaspirillum sp. UKPF54 TaxID=2601898 RepID=UPI0011B18796|nr:polyhydroxyalkanoate depolymerase [Noviherbaspirillum sp. UKPF54]QDZ27684.1 polyhydroxyalkanoate depolymerase [Noviherbaspirillum sp. UKPF54]
MLYQIHELQHVALSPLTQWAEAAAHLFSSSVSPLAYTPFSQNVAAGCELLYRIGKDYNKPSFGIDSVIVGEREVNIRESVVSSKPFCRLLHFEKQTDVGRQPTVLLVAPLSGHHATLLRDTVRALLCEHDVYVTDWLDARMVPLSDGLFHLHDYVHYVQDFIRLLGPQVHVMAICQPTVPVLGAVSLLASAADVLPRSMILMGGPIDGRISPTEVNRVATEKPYSWFESTVIDVVPCNYPGAGRRVYPGFLQHAGFIAMHPEKHMQSYLDFYEDRSHGHPADAHLKFYDEYNAVLDMTAEFYLETIKTVFQEFALPNGIWDVAGKRVRPQDIRDVALMTVEGGQDDICGIGQTRAAHDLCTSIPDGKRHHYDAPECGHYGIFSGHRWREQICPEVTAFIRAHDR